MSKNLFSNELVKGAIAKGKKFHNMELTPEEKELLSEVKESDVVKGGAKLVKASLREAGVDSTIANAVVDVLYHDGKIDGIKRSAFAAGFNHRVVNAHKDEMYKAHYVVDSVFLKKGTATEEYGSNYPAIAGLVTVSNSAIVRTMFEEGGEDESVDSGFVDASIKRVGDEIIVEDSTKHSFLGKETREKLQGCKAYTKPAKRLLSVNLSLLADQIGETSKRFKRIWKEVHTKGVLYDRASKKVYPNTPGNRNRVKDAELYISISESNSANKKATMIFGNFGTNKLSEAIAAYSGLLDGLDGGVLAILGTAGKDGKYAKYGKRVYSMACAHAIEIGSIDLSKVCIAVKTDNWEDKTGLPTNHKAKFETSPIDGEAFIRLSFIIKVLEEKFGIKLDDIEVLISNMQLRVSALSVKSFCKVRTDGLMDEYVQVAKNDPSYEFIGNEDGPCVFIGDANSVKLIKEYIDSNLKIGEMKLHLMNFTHPVDSESVVNLGTQHSNKFYTPRDRANFLKFVAGQTLKAAKKEAGKMVKGNFGASLPASSTLQDLISVVYGEKALNTTIGMRALINAVDDKTNPAAKKARMEMPGCNCAVAMEEYCVISPDKFPHLLTCDGGVFEFYSSDMMKNRFDLFVDYCENGEFKKALDFLFVVLKFPSQGRDEHLLGKLVSLESMAIRIALWYDREVKEGRMEIKEAANYAQLLMLNTKYDGVGSVLMANSNIAASWLAGFDKDFDKLSLITSKGFTELVIDKIKSSTKQLKDTDGNLVWIAGKAVCIDNSTEKVVGSIADLLL